VTLASGFRTLTLLAGLAAAFAAQAAAPLLSIVDVGEATGLTDLQSVDINNRGDVLLQRWNDAAYVWNPVSGLQVIRIPGESLVPLAMNDSREIVGTSAGGGGVHAFRWGSVRGFEIPKLDDGLEGGGLAAVNATGQVAGVAHRSNGQQTAVAGRPDGPLHRLLPAQRGRSQANAINANNQIGGWMTVPGLCCESAVILGKGQAVTLLGTLAAPGEKDHGNVSAINDLGQAVGESYRGGRPHAFYWSAETGMLDLHPLRDDRGWSSAAGINRRGEVVATIHFDEDSSVFSWDEDNGSVDLNARLDPADPLYGVTKVIAGWPRINDQGQIVTDALVRGVYTVVLLTPVPSANKAR